MAHHGERPAGVAAVILAALVGAAPAGAQQQPTRPTARLAYTADPAGRCPDAAALRQAVASRLGQDPFEDDARAVLRAAITRSRAGLLGRVSALDADGHEVGSREVTARAGACADLVEMMAVTASLAFEQPALRRPIEPATAAAPSTAPSTAPALPEAVRAQLAALGPTSALDRIEAALLADGAQHRGANTAAAVSLGVVGAALLGAGIYGFTNEVDPTHQVAIALTSLGAGLGVAGAALYLLYEDPTEPLLHGIRVGRVMDGDPAVTLARTEDAWAERARRQRAGRIRRGVVILLTDALLTAVGAFVLAAQPPPDRAWVPAAAALVLGASTGAVLGALYLALPDAAEQSWRMYQPLRVPTVRPVAAWAGGAVLGLAGTF